MMECAALNVRCAAELRQGPAIVAIRDDEVAGRRDTGVLRVHLDDVVPRDSGTFAIDAAASTSRLVLCPDAGRDGPVRTAPEDRFAVSPDLRATSGA